MNERLIKLMEHLEYTPSVFADEIGVIRSSISHIMSGRNKPGVELLQRVLKRFPEVSAEWLLSGIGPMFKEGARTIVNLVPRHEPVKETPKSGAQTSLLGYIESIRQPGEPAELQEPSPARLPETGNNGSGQPIRRQADVENGAMEENQPVPAAVEIPQAGKKEKAISRIVVYYNDKTYQEFLAAED